MIEELVKYWEEYKELIEEHNQEVDKDWEKRSKDLEKRKKLGKESKSVVMNIYIKPHLYKAPNLEGYMDYLSDKFKKDEN